jgi:hypothetical protein
MVLKRVTVGIIFTVAIAVSAQGATVSFLIVETGLREETPIFESSKIWENALMDVFFDTGHIVSNSPILRLSSGDSPEELPAEARSVLEEAREGGAELFVLAMLDYQHPAKVPGEEPKPRTVSIRVFKTKPFKYVCTQDYSIQAKSTGKDEFVNAMNAARTIVARLNDK